MDTEDTKIMKHMTLLAALIAALMIAGCGKKADEGTTEGGTTGTTAATTGDAKPADEAKGGMEGEYFVQLDAAQQKQMDDAKKQLDELKKKVDAGDAAAKTQYDQAKMMVDMGEKMLADLKLTVMAGNKWSVVTPDGTIEGTFKADGNKLTMTAEKRSDGKPLSESDKKPVEMTYDEAAGTLTGTQDGNTMVFKKK